MTVRTHLSEASQSSYPHALSLAFYTPEHPYPALDLESLPELTIHNVILLVTAREASSLASSSPDYPLPLPTAAVLLSNPTQNFARPLPAGLITNKNKERKIENDRKYNRITPFGKAYPTKL